MWAIAILWVGCSFFGAFADESAHALKPLKVLQDDDVSLSIRRIKDPRDIHYLMQLDIVVYNHFEELSIAVLDEDENELCSGSISPSRNQRTNCIFDPPSSLRSGGNALSIVMSSSAHNEVLFKTTYHFYYPYSMADLGALEATWNAITEKMYNRKEVIGFFGLLVLSNYGIRRYNKHRAKVIVTPPSPPPPSSPPSLPPPPSRGEPWFTRSRSSAVAASTMSTVRVVAKPTSGSSSSSVFQLKHAVQQLLLSAPPLFMSQESTTETEVRQNPIATSPVISLPATKAREVLKPRKEIVTPVAQKKKVLVAESSSSKLKQSSTGISSFLPAILKSKTGALPAAAKNAAQPKKNENNSLIFLLQQWKERLVSNFKWPVSSQTSSKVSKNNSKNSSLSSVNITNNSKNRRSWWKYLIIASGLLLILRSPQAQPHVSVFFHEQQEQSNGSVPIPPQLIKPPANVDPSSPSSSTAIVTSNKSNLELTTAKAPEKTKKLWRSLVLVIAQALVIGFQKLRGLPITPKVV